MNSTVIVVLVIIIIVLVGWFGYKQGYFTGTADNQQDIEINLPGNNSTDSSNSY